MQNLRLVRIAGDDSSVIENLELGSVKVVTARQFDIKDADQTIILIPENGGTIERFGSLETSNKHSSFLHAVTWQQVILTIVILFACLGGLIVLVADVLHGTMNFHIYMQYAVYFLAAMGIGQFGKLFSKDSAK